MVLLGKRYPIYNPFRRFVCDESVYPFFPPTQYAWDSGAWVGVGANPPSPTFGYLKPFASVAAPYQFGWGNNDANGTGTGGIALLGKLNDDHDTVLMDFQVVGITGNNISVALSLDLPSNSWQVLTFFDGVNYNNALFPPFYYPLTYMRFTAVTWGATPPPLSSRELGGF
jgi:hypothetical protein